MRRFGSVFASASLGVLSAFAAIGCDDDSDSPEPTDQTMGLTWDFKTDPEALDLEALPRAESDTCPDPGTCPAAQIWSTLTCECTCPGSCRDPVAVIDPETCQCRCPSELGCAGDPNGSGCVCLPTTFRCDDGLVGPNGIPITVCTASVAQPYGKVCIDPDGDDRGTCHDACGGEFDGCPAGERCDRHPDVEMSPLVCLD